MARKAVRVTIPHGKRSTASNTGMCRGGDKPHVLRVGDPSIYIKNMGWCCVPCGEERL